MQLIFLSTLEKKVEEGRVLSAQVSITEHHGEWRVQCSDSGPDGKPVQDCWYEGAHWQDMLGSYREGLRAMRTDGYAPLIDTVADSPASGRNREVLVLQFYGAQHRREELFQKLRQWRREQASKEGKSAFFIATNRMLDMLSAYLPYSPEELRCIPGFGQRKADAYGAAILAITRSCERTTSFPLQWVESEIDEGAFEAWLAEQRKAKEQQELEKQALRKQMLEGVAQCLPLAELEQQLGLKRQELIRLVEELDKEGYDVEPLVRAELAETSSEETDRVQTLFHSVGDRFLKPVLRGLFTDDQLKEHDVSRLYEQLRLQRILFRHRTAVGAAGATTLAAATAPVEQAAV